MIRRSKLLKSGRPLEVPQIEDMFFSTPATHPCQRDLPKVQEQCQLMLQQSQESHGSNGKFECANIDIDTYYDVTKDVYVPGELRMLHIKGK